MTNKWVYIVPVIILLISGCSTKPTTEELEGKILGLENDNMKLTSDLESMIDRETESNKYTLQLEYEIRTSNEVLVTLKEQLDQYKNASNIDSDADDNKLFSLTGANIELEEKIVELEYEIEENGKMKNIDKLLVESYRNMLLKNEDNIIGDKISSIHIGDHIADVVTTYGDAYTLTDTYDEREKSAATMIEYEDVLIVFDPLEVMRIDIFQTTSKVELPISVGDFAIDAIEVCKESYTVYESIHGGTLENWFVTDDGYLIIYVDVTRSAAEQTDLITEVSTIEMIEIVDTKLYD